MTQVLYSFSIRYLTWTINIIQFCYVVVQNVVKGCSLHKTPTNVGGRVASMYARLLLQAKEDARALITFNVLFSFLNFQEDQKNGRGDEFQTNIMMRGLSPSDYVLHTLANVNTNDLEQTLLVSDKFFVCSLLLDLILCQIFCSILQFYRFALAYF